MPGPKPTQLTPSGVKKLERATKAIEDAEQAWAQTVRELGISAVARHLNVTPQALQSRLRRIERDK